MCFQKKKTEQATEKGMDRGRKKERRKSNLERYWAHDNREDKDGGKAYRAQKEK